MRLIKIGQRKQERNKNLQTLRENENKCDDYFVFVRTLQKNKYAFLLEQLIYKGDSCLAQKTTKYNFIFLKIDGLVAYFLLCA